MKECHDIVFLESLWDWSGLRVLDIGCGQGILCAQLAALGASVIGVEPDADQRAAAVAHSRSEDSGAAIHDGGADALPCADGAIDVALFNRSLHHVPTGLMHAALAEAARVLRPGGRLVVLEPDAAGQMSRIMEPFHDERAVRAAALAAMDRMDRSAALTLAEERWYSRVYTFPDLPTFKARMRGMRFVAIDHEAVDDPRVAERFAVGATGEGFRFTNPIRVRLYLR